MTNITTMTQMQAHVLEVPEEYHLALFGGRGSGKTTSAILLGMAHLKKYGDDAHILILRRNLKSLANVEADIDALLTASTGGLYGYNKAEKVFRVGGGRIELGVLENERDYRKYQGRSYTLVIFDEVQFAASESLVRLVLSNLRGPDHVITRAIYCGNPGGKLAPLIFNKFINGRDNYVPYDLDLGDGAAQKFVTVVSTLDDNPHVGEKYLSALMSATAGNPVLRRQWIYGSFETGHGLMFPGFNAAVHVLERPSGFQVPKDVCRLYVAADFGISSPSVAFIGLIFKRDAHITKDKLMPKGSVWLIDEVTDAIMDNPEDLSKSREWTPDRLGETIVWRCNDYGITHPNGCIDTARGLRGEMLHTEMASTGFWSLTPPRKGRRMEGYITINSFLDAAMQNDPHRPHLYIDPSCKYLLATLPNAMRDEQNPDDVADTPDCPDHGLDALRYFLNEARTSRSASSGTTIGMW